jgi:P27 family predicted phage terminase small subunit
MPPEHLSEAAKVEFARISAFLAGKRVISAEDVDALEVYATSLVRYREAQAAIATEGAVITGAKGMRVKNPWTAIESAAADRLRPLFSEFGLTPTARGRLKTPDAPDEDTKFFEGGQ